MKPEHFIYKSDGLYYMQNVPAIPDARDAESLGAYSEIMKCYHESLERAKEEAVKVDDDSSRLEIGFRISKAYDLGKNQSELGKIYTINMEEKIEIVDVCNLHSRQYCGMCTMVYKPVARIAAPKKEEEMQEQVYYNVKYFLVDKYCMVKTPAKSFGEAESNVYSPGMHIVSIKRTRVKPKPVKPL